MKPLVAQLVDLRKEYQLGPGIEPVRALRDLARAAGKAAPEVVVSMRMAGLDDAALRERVTAYREVGATRIAFNFPYEDSAGFRRTAERISGLLV